MARAKRKLPAKPAGFVFSHHRSPSCCRHPIPEHKAPAADDNTHPTKTSRPGQTAPTDTRTQKNPLPLRTPPAGFVFSHHRGHSCCRHPIPEHKAPAADDNTHPTKTSRPGQTAPTDTRTQKNPLPLRTPPAAFFSPQHRRHFCRRQPAPERKKPAAAPNTAGRFHFSATPQSLLPPSSDTRTQSPRRRRQYTPHKNLTARSNGTDRYPNTKKTRCRSEHRRPVLFFRTTAVPPAAVIRYPNTKPRRRRQYTPHKNLTARSNGTNRRPNTKNPLPLRTPPAGAQHHLTQPNPNISGRRFTAFFALRCL